MQTFTMQIEGLYWLIFVLVCLISSFVLTASLAYNWIHKPIVFKYQIDNRPIKDIQVLKLSNT